MSRSDCLRLFVALYPPGPTVEAALALVDRADLPRHKPVAPSQVHMTLLFLGDVARSRIAEVTESVDRSAAGIGPIELGAVRLASLPERGHARLVALETDAPSGLLELQRRLAHRLARNPRQRGAERFLPHLTLARFGGAGLRDLRISEPARLEPFRIDSVRVMSSVLGSSGAVHSEIHRVALQGRSEG